MGYIGKVPADVLIDPHVDSAAITDGTIITADIANDAVTSAKLAQNSVDSSELIDGSVDNSHLAGSIAINKTLLTAGTGLTLSTNTLSVDAAQTQITSVGTLRSLTTSGSTGSNYIGSFTNTSATGWGLFVKGGADNADYTLRVQDKDADDLFSIKGGGSIGVGTNDPSSATNVLLSVGNTSLPYAGMEFIGGTNAERWRLYTSYDDNADALFGIYRVADSSYKFQVGESGKATFAGELRVDGGQASIYGAEGGNAILELNSDQADDNADRWQMYVTANNNYLKWRHYGTGSWVDRMWLSSATDNWAFNIIGNSPYGIQVTTTSDGSSSHDAFVIKRAGNAKVFEIFNNGTLTTYGGGTATFAGNITQSASSNLRHTITAGGSGEASLVLTANNSTGDSFVRWETNSTTFCMGIDNSDGDKFILSAGSDPHSDSVINIQPGGSSIAIDKPTSFGSRIDFTGKPNIGNRVHSVSISSGSSSQYNMNGAGGNCSGGFIVGACHRQNSITADNSVCIYAHAHTQGANVYSAIIERNDDSDVTISHNGSGMLTCTNNGNSTVNFIVKYILFTGFDTSNNLR